MGIGRSLPDLRWLFECCGSFLIADIYIWPSIFALLDIHLSDPAFEFALVPIIWCQSREGTLWPPSGKRSHLATRRIHGLYYGVRVDRSSMTVNISEISYGVINLNKINWPRWSNPLLKVWMAARVICPSKISGVLHKFGATGPTQCAGPRLLKSTKNRGSANRSTSAWPHESG